MKPAPHVRSSITADGIILLDIRSGRIFSANAVAARIWSGLTDGLPMDAIVARIASETGAEPAVVERDASDFLTVLIAHALVAEIREER